jgi:hypothetical protein
VSIDSRLTKLMPTLTAKERAILVLRSFKDKTPEDPAWRSTMPREQDPEFNRLISVMNTCNTYLPLLIAVLEQQTEQFYQRLLWLETMIAMGVQAWEIAKLVPVAKRKQAEKGRGDHWPLVELPWVKEDEPPGWLNVCDQAEEAFRSSVVSLWQQLREVEILLDEVALEFDGEDPLRSANREVLDSMRSRLTALHRVLASQKPLELSEPDEESLALIRTYFAKGQRLMGGL